MYRKMTPDVKRRLCESVDPEEAAVALARVSGMNSYAMPMELVRQGSPNQYSNPSVQGAVLDFIRKIEGFRIRLREFHWSVLKKSEHTNTDEAMKYYEDQEDAIAEDMQGLLGVRIKIGDLIPVMPPENLSLPELFHYILYTTVVMKETLSDCGERGIDGLCNLFDDMIHQTNKFEYLATFS